MKTQSINYKEINLGQTASETNSTTIYRYKQFYLNMEKRDNPLSILDVGCNTGRGGEVLKKLNSGYRLFGLDCVKERLEKAEKSYDCIINCNATAIPLPDESVDSILAGEFIEHLTYSDASSALAEFHRVLKKDGQILLTTPNPGYIKIKLTNSTILGGAHLSQFNPKELIKIMRGQGFSKFTLKGSGRIAKYLNDFWPFMWIYGSYLVSAKKK